MEELGWEQPARRLSERLIYDGELYEGTPIASLAGVMVFELYASGGQVPEVKARASRRQISLHDHENLLLFVDKNRTQSVWYWVKREGNKRYARSHHYVRGQSGALFLNCAHVHRSQHPY